MRSLRLNSPAGCASQPTMLSDRDRPAGFAMYGTFDCVKQALPRT